MNPSASAVADDLLVRKSITVQASVDRAFKVFTQQMSTWWPLATHKIGKADAKEAIMEPRVGGRWYERGVDGTECDWGRVLVWEPPHRVVLSWEISCDWRSDANLQTEVDVRFVQEGTATRVELEHRKLRAYGERALEMKGIFESEGGWTGLLARFAARASAA